jgi:hypothetical protein
LLNSILPYTLRRGPSLLALIVAVGVLVTMPPVPSAHAQEFPDLRIGIRGGPTFGFLSDSAVPFRGSGVDLATNVNPRIDFHVGGYVVMPLTDRLSVQPELLFLQRGGHISRPTSESYAAERYRLSYAQGAVLARRGISVSGPLSIHLVGGFAANLALDGRLRRNRETAGIDFQNQVDLLQTNQLRRWDASGIIGVGFGYPVGTSSRAALEIRYNRGFRSVFERSPAPDRPFPLTGSSSLRHDVITASLSYTLPLASLF